MYDINIFSNKLLQYGENLLENYLTGESAEKLYGICERLEKFSKLFNLTAITEPEEVIKKHIIDCLYLACQIEKLSEGKGGNILDVGSGAGFPSLPTGAVLPQFSVTALDSTAKKIGYIKETADVLGISDFDAIAGRAEDIARTDKREAFDFVTARAVARLSVLCELCIPFVKVGGYFVSMKGAAADEEIKEAEKAVKTLGCQFIDCVPYSISGLPDKRFLVIYKKISSTNGKYPRNFSQISKKPL